jgi:hypothetical protein
MPTANRPPLSPRKLSVLDDLLSRHGEVVGGEALMRCLGYRSARSFARAGAQGQLPVATFALAGRRGRYAKTRDVAEWLETLGKNP